MGPDLPARLKAALHDPAELRRLVEQEVIPALLELRAIEADTVKIPRLSLDRPASEQGLGPDADQTWDRPAAGAGSDRRGRLPAVGLGRNLVFRLGEEG